MLPLARADHGALLRQLTLFLAMLISGGLLIFPRIPILLLMLSLCLFLPGFRLVIRRETVPVLVLFGAILLVSLLRPGPLQLESLAIRVANFVAGFALLNVYLAQGYGNLSRDLYRILGWMAVQALATVAAALVVPFLFVPVTIAETTYQSVLLLLNYHVMIEDAGLLVRPDGFFFEPGVFQIYLNLHLYLALFVFRSPRRAVLALAAVLSTQSTTGLVICLILLGAYAFGEMRRTSLRRRILVGFAAVLLAAPIGGLVYQNVMSKLFGEAQGSSWARTYDLVTGLNVLAAHPWIGIGFDHDRYKEEAARLGYADTQLAADQAAERSTSNGILFLLYSLGVPLSLPFLFGMFRQRFFPHRTLIGLLLFLSFLSESIISTPVFQMLIFSGLLLPHAAPAAAVGTARRATAP